MKRYCGCATIEVEYVEPGPCEVGNGSYNCRISTPFITAEFAVGTPVVLIHAVDSPQALDDAAQAALSFAQSANIIDDGSDLEYDTKGSYVISRGIPIAKAT